MEERLESSRRALKAASAAEAGLRAAVEAKARQVEALEGVQRQVRACVRRLADITNLADCSLSGVGVDLKRRKHCDAMAEGDAVLRSDYLTPNMYAL